MFLKFGGGYRLQLVYIFFSIFVLLLLGNRIALADDVSVSDGNEDFRFNAFIREKDVIDGTPGWDNNDEPGNDSGPKNGIVRSFDTVTYPLKVTVNPKKTKTLQNIQLKITGKLHDGFKDGRAVGSFAVGNYTEMIDAKNGNVTFSQKYTMKSSGTAVMIPVTVNVQGAKPDQYIYPDFIRVDVVSVDGKKVENVNVTFNQLKKIRVSAKVSVGAIARGGFAYNDIIQPAERFVNSYDGNALMHAFDVTVFGQPLPGRTSFKGSTFPTGKINYHLEMDGKVDFEGTAPDGTDLDRTLTDSELPKLFDVTTIDRENIKQSSKNTYSFDLTDRYTNRYIQSNYAGSYMLDKNGGKYDVWDSGKWQVSRGKTVNGLQTVNGSASDYVIGNTFPEFEMTRNETNFKYTTRQKPFLTQRFYFWSENYFSQDGGDKNPYSINNTVTYNLKFVIDSYEDDNGQLIKVNQEGTAYSAERNLFGRGYTIHLSLVDGETGAMLGHWRPWQVQTTGDVTQLRGKDVAITSAFFSSFVMHGGAQVIYKWNIDSFDFPIDYAYGAKHYLLRNGYRDFGEHSSHTFDTEHITIKFGVPKNKDMSFKKLMGYKREDYMWFDKYEDAVKVGEVGAIMKDVNDTLLGNSTSIDTYTGIYPGIHYPGQYKDFGTQRLGIRLKSTSKVVGSLNEKGTPNIATAIAYAYSDSKRSKEVLAVHGDNATNPTLYDSNGKMTLLQSPVGYSVNFETLGIMDAQSSVKIWSDKDSYYISENQKWTMRSVLSVPQGSVVDDYVQLHAKLGTSFDYIKNSAYYMRDDKKVFVEPTMTESNGKTVLSWTMPVNTKTSNVPDIHFETRVNPYRLQSGVVLSDSVDAIIESNFDQRPEQLRSYNAEVTLLKIGQVGVSESIEKSFGDKNSDYTLHLRPFTTIEDEYGVKGLTRVPSNEDNYGSKFNGSTYLKKATITSDKELNLYVNSQVIDVKDPNEVDVTKDGWMTYDEAVHKGLLHQTKSIYFVIPGVLSNKDQPLIDLTFGTNGNEFHDIYYNEVVTNSNTHYPMSPVSNKVSYEIKAELELALRKIQIYTDLASKGLPVNVYLNKEILQEAGKNQMFALNLYRKDTNDKVAGKAFKGTDDISVVKFTIPSSKLVKDDNHLYEARIEGYNTNRVYAVKGKDKVDTQGYSSAEKVIYSKDKDLDYKGVVMTEREVGFDMVKYYETIHVPVKKLTKTKSGYGYDLPAYKLKYTNELGYRDSKVQDYTPDLVLNKHLVDRTMSYKIKGDYKIVALDMLDAAISGDAREFKYELPEVSVHVGDGLSYNKQEILKLPESKQHEYVDGGRKLYIPIWIGKLGNYDIHFGGEDKLGVNHVSLDVEQDIHVYAYMYEASRSESIADDEVMLKPQMQAVK